MAPTTSDFTRKERHVISAHRTAAQVQRYLRTLAYNWEKDGKTCRSFRGVVREGRAHCLEGAITAAVIMEQHGHPPLLVSIESQDQIDHVLFLFRHRGRYGAIARSRDLGLHGRKPVYRSVRDLVMSYFDAYIDKTGRIPAMELGTSATSVATIGGCRSATSGSSSATSSRCPTNRSNLQMLGTGGGTGVTSSFAGATRTRRPPTIPTGTCGCFESAIRGSTSGN